MENMTANNAVTWKFQMGMKMREWGMTNIPLNGKTAYIATKNKQQINFFPVQMQSLG